MFQNLTRTIKNVTTYSACVSLLCSNKDNGPTVLGVLQSCVTHAVWSISKPIILSLSLWLPIQTIFPIHVLLLSLWFSSKHRRRKRLSGKRLLQRRCDLFSFFFFFFFFLFWLLFSFLFSYTLSKFSLYSSAVLNTHLTIMSSARMIIHWTILRSSGVSG